ncbi:hypothetical protein PR202_gb13201 [Eleusine coracana subsp. coracana]|uniref:Uncharacterized protein n=1 Tax=Eleusine coracana subsp. coracana TaxID=191504 RepID=A0AAV5ET57_ELECO|nr:hypothetical protein PR202_gb13201 [Eleusine coracana subsp. coracana]
MAPSAVITHRSAPVARWPPLSLRLLSPARPGEKESFAAAAGRPTRRRLSPPRLCNCARCPCPPATGLSSPTAPRPC